jgi:hypothetical protein
MGNKLSGICCDFRENGTITDTSTGEMKGILRPDVMGSRKLGYRSSISKHNFEKRMVPTFHELPAYVEKVNIEREKESKALIEKCYHDDSKDIASINASNQSINENS